jgi:hypothetical protein
MRLDASDFEAVRQGELLMIGHAADTSDPTGLWGSWAEPPFPPSPPTLWREGWMWAGAWDERQAVDA